MNRGFPHVLMTLLLLVPLTAGHGLAAETQTAATTLTYENWARGFFTQHCTGCHSSHLSGPDRWGSPEYFNFDTYEDLRRWRSLIRYAAASANPIMPPAGGVWQWERDALLEWLDAGLPGTGQDTVPARFTRGHKTHYYNTAMMHFSGPLDSDYHLRSLTLAPDKPLAGQAHDIDTTLLRIHDQNGAVMLSREWTDALSGLTRREEYDPPIPWILRQVAHDSRAPGAWEADVRVTETRLDNAGAPVASTTRTETWQLTEMGIENIDNGVHLPYRTYHTRLTNRSTGVDTHLWFQESGGLVRRTEMRPSAVALREVLDQVCVFKREEPLMEPLTDRFRQPVWIPLIGEKGDRIVPPDLDYQWQYEIKHYDLFRDPLHPGDLDGDGRVTYLDAFLFAAQWHHAEPAPASDINADADVNADDLLLLLDARRKP